MECLENCTVHRCVDCGHTTDSIERITTDQIEDHIDSNKEAIEILTDIANGDYSVDNFRADLASWKDGD